MPKLNGAQHLPPADAETIRSHAKRWLLPSSNSRSAQPRHSGHAGTQRLVGRPETFDRKLASGGEQGRMSPSLEVAMRPAEVFVRELAPDEGARLKSISKRAKHQSKRARAMIVLASSTGMAAPQIAALMRTDESHVRKVIHAFNDQGFGSLRRAPRHACRP